MTNNPLNTLIRLMDLETIEHNLFRGSNYDIGGRSLFGGQVIAQALMASYRTLQEPRQAHSLHAYFLRPGDLNLPVVYEVDRIRDGGSFTTRRVVAIQHGEAILNLSASFQYEEEGCDHQSVSMPDVPPPEAVEPEIELRKRVAGRLPERLRSAFLSERPIEIRPIDPVDFFKPEQREPRKQVWFRTPTLASDDLSLHQALLAYASDFGLLGAGMLPHQLSFTDPNVQAASLDHSIWFHQRCRADEWLLYDMESTRAAHSRSYNRGQVFNRHGNLVATICQEGLMRVRR